MDLKRSSSSARAEYLSSLGLAGSLATGPPKPKGTFGVVRGSEGMARLASTVLAVVIVELVLARHTVLVFISTTLTVETALTHTSPLLSLNTEDFFVLGGIFSKSHCIGFGGVGGGED